jgi:phospholipid/cholesterol/gamma-HCH transport system substrate-binding protein
VKENRAAVKEHHHQRQRHHRRPRPQISKILENVKQVTDDVRGARRTTPPGANGQAGRDPQRRMERVNRASASLESTLAHADNVAARIDRGEGTVGRLTKDETLINEVEGVVEDVGDLVGGIGRVQTVVGLRTDYNFLANTVKSYVELRLQPSEDKYYAHRARQRSRAARRAFEQIDVDTTNPNDPPHYREARTITNEFRFSFQFAKRLGRSPAASASSSRPAASASICTCSTIASSCGKTCSASAKSCRPAGASPSATSSSASCGCSAASTTSSTTAAIAATTSTACSCGSDGRRLAR